VTKLLGYRTADSFARPGDDCDPAVKL